MRAAACQSDFNSFRSGIPSSVPDKKCKELMDTIVGIML